MLPDYLSSVPTTSFRSNMPPSKLVRNVHQCDPKSQSSTASPQHKAPRASRSTNIFPVPKSDPICRTWPMILRTIVRKMNHTGVCMITCVRRGRSPDPRDSTTTVLVICNSEKPLSHREHSIVKIRELLDSNYLSGVAVNFVRGDFVRGASGLNAEELDRRAIQLPSMPGQSLALNNASGSGTLGGFLELKMPGEAKYRTMALTCFHCVNPRETGLDRALVKRLRVWRQEGIAPDDDMRTELQVQHPSRTAVKEKIKSLKDAIHAIEENEEYVQFSELEGDIESICGRHAAKAFSRMTSTLCELKEFFQDIEAFKQADRGYFGPVYAGSGFRETCSTTPSNLDWALIEVPHDRVGENIVKLLFSRDFG